MLMLTMSRVLVELLGAREPEFSQTILELEHAVGGADVDVRLTAEIGQKARQKLRELGLDPSDSTGQEVYHALQMLVAKHDEFLTRLLGVSSATRPELLLQAIDTHVSMLDMNRQAWVLKQSVARRVLKVASPKKTMKLLGYRSVDSMLKRESIAELFVGAHLTESVDWWQRLVRSYKKLSPQDFEMREIEMVVMAEQRWGVVSKAFVANKRMHVTSLKELGVIGLLPPPKGGLQGICLVSYLLAIHYIEEIRLYSSYFKLQQVKPTFAETLVHSLLYDDQHGYTMLGRPVHWRILRRHFGRPHGRHYPELFQPHMQPEDVAIQVAEDVLYKLEPAFHFWSDLGYVGEMYDGQVVSFNLMDAAVNYANKLEYADRVSYGFQTELWHELLARYIGEEALERDMLRQIDSGSLDEMESAQLLEEVMAL